MTYDEILAAILADIRNQQPDADLTEGSVLFIMAVRTASALWGLYSFLAAQTKNIFPDTSDTAALEHHAFIKGLAREQNETDAELLNRLLGILRTPPSGGTKSDYETWARAVDGVASALCIPAAQGAGTVSIIILADAETTGSEIPGQTLLDVVVAHINAVRPVTVSAVYILAPQFLSQDITISTTGTNAQATISAAIEDYVLGLQPGDTLLRSKLIAIALENGASDVVISAPAANVLATQYQVIRPGTITVS